MFGRDAIDNLRGAVARVAAAFDAALVSPTEAAAIIESAAAIESMAATIKALAARRVAETTLWRREGDATAAHHLARVTGTSVGQARTVLETAQRLEQLPATDAAARSGALSPAQVSAVADAAAAAPAAEERLLSSARETSLGELRDECARVKAAAHPDPDAQRAAVHAGRYARRLSCPDGSAEIRYRATPEAVAEVWAVVDGYCNREFDRARAEGRREPFEAYAADAMLAMARAARSGDESGGRRPSPTKVIVRIDHDALLRGRVEGDEVCEIAGLGPVAVTAVREMVERGDAFVAAIVTRGTDVSSVVHLGRKPIALQRTALEWCAPSCTVLGCNRSARLEIDHRVDWSATQHTTLGELDALCHQHHALKTRGNWKLVEGEGKRPLVPPDDTRHPDRAGARAGPAFQCA